MQISQNTWELIGKISSIVTISGISFGTVLFLIYQTVKRAVSKKFDSEVKQIVLDAIESKMPALIDQLISDAERSLLLMAQVLSLHSLKHYDEVLKTFEWNGDLSRLRKINLKVRHCIIQSLYNSTVSRKENRETSWAALEDLLNEGNRDPATIKLLLEIGISSKKYKETFDKISHFIEGETNADVLVLTSTLYRKLGNSTKAEVYARKAHSSAPSLDTVLAISVLLRDQGEFDQAHSLLSAETKKISKMLIEGQKVPDGWNRIFNTYIANCIDMKDEASCIDEVEIFSKHLQSPVETSTVGRYLLNIKKRSIAIDPTRYERIHDNFSSSMRLSKEGEAKKRCEALLKQLSGNNHDAINLLKGYISTETSLKDVERAYLQCYLAAIYFEEKIFEKSIEILIGIKDHSLIAGEGEYLLSKCYAAQGKDTESVMWLRNALSREGRWRSKALRNQVLQANEGVRNFLASQAMTQISEQN